VNVAAEPGLFDRPVTEQADADLLIAIREAAAECDALCSEKLGVMRAFIEVSTKLAASRERYNVLRATVFRGKTTPRFALDGSPAGSIREDTLDPGPVRTLEHLASDDYKIRALLRDFTRATVLRG
jgi:hypothetical protein